MIPFSAALPVAFGEQLPVRPSEQRQVVDREQRSEQRSAGQPEYLAASRVRLRRHRALITAIPYMDIPPTAIRHTGTQAMDTEPTLRPAMDIRDIPVLPHTLVPRAMGTRAIPDTLSTPVRRATVHRVAWSSRTTSVPPPIEIRGTWEKPRCRRLRDLRARRPLPLTPFPVIDRRRSPNLTLLLRLKLVWARPIFLMPTRLGISEREARR